MKPIIIFEFEEYGYSPEKAEEVDKYISSLDLAKRYDILVVWGGHVKVFYPNKSIMFYYHKLKIWLTRKTLKRFTF